MYSAELPGIQRKKVFSDYSTLPGDNFEQAHKFDRDTYFYQKNDKEKLPLEILQTGAKTKIFDLERDQRAKSLSLGLDKTASENRLIRDELMVKFFDKEILLSIFLQFASMRNGVVGTTVGYTRAECLDNDQDRVTFDTNDDEYVF